MKKASVKILAAMIAAGLILSAAGCNNRSDGDSSAQSTVSEVTVVSEPDTDSEEPDIGEHKDYETQSAKGEYFGNILVVDMDGSKRCMEMLTADESSGEFYASELNTMKERLGAKINVYSMEVPTACELYCPSNYRGDMDSQRDIMKNIEESLIGVKHVDVLTTLTNHNAENIYLRTDTRWSPLGAYYAGKVFAKIADVPYADISEYTASKTFDYVGNMSMFIDYNTLETLKEDPDEFVYYKPNVKYKTFYYDENFEFLTDGNLFEEVPDSMYDTYYKGGFYCIKLETEVKNGRKLIIIKDNAGTAMAPFFTSSFEEIYVVDKDYLEANLVEMIEDFKITDVLYCLDMFTVTTQNVYTLESLRTQATHGRLEDNATDSDDAGSANSESTDTEESESGESEIQYIFDVGLNNSVGVVEPSETEQAQPDEQYEDPYNDNYEEDYVYDEYQDEEEDYY